MSDKSEFRLLEIGEIIKSDDMVIGYDDTGWEPVPAHLIGSAVWSDWRMVSNLKFRRIRGI